MAFRVLSLAPVLICSALLWIPQSLAEGSREQAAVAAAQKWLALVDKGEYAKSWDEAAQYFQANVSKDRWEQQVKGVREPLGALIERKVKSRQFAKQLPGAPDGEYVVIQFQTKFEHKQSAIETVTPMKDKNGAWRVSGYFIR